MSRIHGLLRILHRDLGRDLSPKRWAHTLRTVNTAKELAQLHGVDMDKTIVAAYLHDCAKGLEKNYEHLKLWETMEYPEIAKELPKVWHGPIGAYKAKVEFGVEDEEILNSIMYHSVGHPDFSYVGYVVFVADYIEPGRDSEYRCRIYEIAKEDLIEGVKEVVRSKIEYLKNKNRIIHPCTSGLLKYLNESVVCQGVV